MPLTRYERGVIEDLMNKVVKQQDSINFLQGEVARLNTTIVNLGNSGILALSPKEQAEALEESVKIIIRKLNVKKHNHLSDQEGGPAFAKKGATLISDDPKEND